MLSISRLALATLALAFAGRAPAAFNLHVDGAQYQNLDVGVGIGDLTRDSLDDLIIVSPAGDADRGNLMVLSQPRSTSRMLTFTHGNSVLGSTGAMKVADVDHDGFVEVLAGTKTGFTLVMSDPASDTFLYSRAFDSGVQCDRIAVADLDADGYPDAVCQNANDGVVVYLNEGAASPGVFQAMTQQAGIGVGGDAIALGDVTGDGYPDLVAIDGDDASRSLVLYRNDGKGTFQEGIVHARAVAQPYAGLAIGDFDSDGRQEAAVGTASDASASILIHEWNGSKLTVSTTISTSETAEFMLARDIDRDGDDDLLFVHPNAASIAWLLQSSHRLQGPEGASEGAYVGSGITVTDVLTVGDLDDDGCTDAFSANGYSSALVHYGAGCTRRRAPSDFDGDGISDLLWHNNATGATEYWRSASFSAYIRLTTVNNPQWSIAGTGDFDGDGKSDVFWRNGVTGAGAIWKSGNFATQQAVTRITNPAWQVAGIGDFDGDGKDDLLWRNFQTGGNAIWRSGDFASQIAVTAITNLAWKIAGVGDFDGDGKDDILWRNATNGVNAIWRSGDYRKQMPVVAVANTAWQVAGIGDFDGDGRADLVWRNSIGTNALWPAADASVSAKHALPVLGTAWHLAAVGDFDGNGKDDILWRDDGTGESEYWRSGYSTLARQVAWVPGAAWQIIK